jgi:hypothetical protein
VKIMTTWVHTHLPRLTAGERDCLSVKVPGQRIAYASDIVLENVTFKVHEAGRRRCLESGQRNVHAWVVGTEKVRWFGGRTDRPWSTVPGWRRALYDPFKGGSFVDSETLEPVASASAAIISGKFVHYLP